MELLLNTFWLLIAVGALGIWIRQWRRGARRRDLPLQLFALGCVLVFLLPVISASDDLHATALAVEASGFSRKILLKSITPSGASVHTHVLAAVLLLALFSAAGRKLVVGAATEQRVLLSVTGFIHPVDDRAPPSVLLLA